VRANVIVENRPIKEQSLLFAAAAVDVAFSVNFLFCVHIYVYNMLFIPLPGQPTKPVGAPKQQSDRLR